MTTEKDETFTVLVKGKPLANVKADLIHAFLSVSISITINDNNITHLGTIIEWEIFQVVI